LFFLGFGGCFFFFGTSLSLSSACFFLVVFFAFFFGDPSGSGVKATEDGADKDEDGAKNAGGSGIAGGGIIRVSCSSSSTRFARFRLRARTGEEPGDRLSPLISGVERGSEGGSWELVSGGMGRVSDVGIGWVSGMSIISAFCSFSFGFG
jgi:hypothetical protein